MVDQVSSLHFATFETVQLCFAQCSCPDANAYRDACTLLESTIETPSLEYLILDDIEIPDFYNLEAQILEVEDVIASDKFWEYLDAQITDTNEVTRHGIAGILAIIKKKGAYDDKCNSLFKKLRIGKVKKSLKDSYFKRLRNYY